MFELQECASPPTYVAHLSWACAAKPHTLQSFHKTLQTFHKTLKPFHTTLQSFPWRPSAYIREPLPPSIPQTIEAEINNPVSIPWCAFPLFSLFLYKDVSLLALLLTSRKNESQKRYCWRNQLETEQARGFGRKKRIYRRQYLALQHRGVPYTSKTQ